MPRTAVVFILPSTELVLQEHILCLTSGKGHYGQYGLKRDFFAKNIRSKSVGRPVGRAYFLGFARFLGFGLFRSHKASTSITSGTHTSGAQ